MATPAVHARKTTERDELVRPAANARYVWAVARILLGFVFLWAFLDKTFGLGYSTKPQNAWIQGGSPTYGFLANTKGWLSGFYQALATNQVVEVLFMVGLLGIGLALLLGIGMRIATASGVTMLGLMYLAKLPATTNPVYDADLMYAVLLVGLFLVKAGRTLGLGEPWSRLPVVQRYPILE